MFLCMSPPETDWPASSRTTNVEHIHSFWALHNTSSSSWLLRLPRLTHAFTFESPLAFLSWISSSLLMQLNMELFFYLTLWMLLLVYVSYGLQPKPISSVKIWASIQISLLLCRPRNASLHPPLLWLPPVNPEHWSKFSTSNFLELLILYAH